MVMWPLPTYKQPAAGDARMLSSRAGEPRSTTHRRAKWPPRFAGGTDLAADGVARAGAAFWQQGDERKRDVADTVYFRDYRPSLFPAVAKNENALEMNEGMAEYTGFKLSTSSAEEYPVQVAAWLRGAPTRTPSYGRSFAYTSGPAYAGLLDAAGINWRTGLTPATDLGKLLAQAYGVQVPASLDKAEAMRRAEHYDGGEVIAIETEHEVKHQAQVTVGRKLFVDGPILVLPTSEKINYIYDPNTVLALDDNLTLYQYEGEIHVTDEWGMLKTSVGVVLARENGSSRDGS
jgi:hypothetical protein